MPQIFWKGTQLTSSKKAVAEELLVTSHSSLVTEKFAFREFFLRQRFESLKQILLAGDSDDLIPQLAVLEKE